MTTWKYESIKEVKAKGHINVCPAYVENIKKMYIYIYIEKKESNKKAERIKQPEIILSSSHNVSLKLV